MGSSKKVTTGFHYRVLYHAGLCKGPIDAFLEFRGGDKVAWKGELAWSDTISVNAPALWGGEKDQGGIDGEMDVMFGGEEQEPNTYLLSQLGPQIPAWRGIASVVFKGGRYGANNPYPQKGSYKLRKLRAGWDNGCWYPEKAGIPDESLGSTCKMYSCDAYRTAAEYVFANVWPMNDSNSGAVNSVPGGASLNAWGGPGFERPSIINNGCSGDHSISTDGTNGLSNSGLAGVARRGTFAGFFRRASSLSVGVMLCQYSSLTSGSPGLNVQIVHSHVSGNVGAYLHWGSTTTLLREFGQLTTTGSDHLFFRWQIDLLDSLCTITYRIAKNFEWVDEEAVFETSTPGPNDINGVTAFRLGAGGGEGQTLNQLCGYSPYNMPDSVLDILAEGFARNDPSYVDYNCIGYMNPAHILYYSRTNSEMGREPVENINDASMRAAADWFFDNGLGLCATRDPSKESPDEFEQRIARVAGCSFERSISDGQWYIDIANGEYDLETLPILTDDDILDFRELPSTLDNAINSLSVTYLDAQTKERPTTPPARALGLVSNFGTIHQTRDYPEIPAAGIALRVASRELLTTVTPTRAFDLVTTRKPFDWRKNQYFRLQSVKRGIADMVCIVGEIQTGTLKSGAIKLKAVQDIYSLPDVVYIEHEQGVDTRPSQVPIPIVEQRAIETPYIDLVATLSAADRDALDEDAGFVIAVAVDPARSLDFTMRVAPDGDVVYTEVGTGEFCPTALVIEEADDRAETEFTLEDGLDLHKVEIGTAVLWDDEICRVNALNSIAGTISLGRGCADTVAALHSAGSRLWFYQSSAASDETEYTAGETIQVKLLTNTGSQQLPESAATEMPLTFVQRITRPYPPGNLKLNGTAYLATVSGALTVTWAHRDRLMQADQLIDTTAASIGPETNTRYTLQFYDEDDILIIEREDIGLPTADVVLDYTGDVTLKIWSVSDIATSMQALEHTFAYTPPGGASSITATDYEPYVPTWEIDGNGG